MSEVIVSTAAVESHDVRAGGGAQVREKRAAVHLAIGGARVRVCLQPRTVILDRLADGRRLVILGAERSGGGIFEELDELGAEHAFRNDDKSSVKLAAGSSRRALAMHTLCADNVMVFIGLCQSPFSIQPGCNVH